jgi:CO/xanthine dehydrogenase FAD-binding subunit
MVDVNFGRRRPREIVALRRVGELQGWSLDGDTLELGSLLTFAQVQGDLGALAPGLAGAARTVGSPQIRNAGTLGGNLATASPAGDALPYLVALDAEVVLARDGGERAMPLEDFLRGPKRTALEPGELIRAVRVRRTSGPQEFCKVGTRNAMVISIACLALVLDVERRRVRVGLGAVGPVPLRPRAAEDAASQALDWDRLTAGDDDVEAFARLCAEAAAPITDHRSTAPYRRHAIAVVAGRALRRSLAA